MEEDDSTQYVSADIPSSSPFVNKAMESSSSLYSSDLIRCCYVTVYLWIAVFADNTLISLDRFSTIHSTVHLIWLFTHLDLPAF